MSYLQPHDDARCGKTRTAREVRGNVVHFTRPCPCRYSITRPGNRCAPQYFVTWPTLRVLPKKKEDA